MYTMFFRPAQPSLDRIHDMTSLDICVDWFDPQRALSLVVMQKTRQVCDVLLDQQILPGVGNIIKNEVSKLSLVYNYSQTFGQIQ